MMATDTLATAEKKAMEPGIYILSETIANPKPDHRVTRDWTEMEWWKKGDAFLVEHIEAATETRGTKVASVFNVYRLRGSNHSLSALRVRDYGDGKLEIVRQKPEAKVAALQAVLAALRPSTEPIDAFRWAFYADGRDPSAASERVLWQLVEAGKVTLDDIRAVLAARDKSP